MKVRGRVLCFLILSLILDVASSALGKTEYVTVVKILDNDDKAIIQRTNGEQWLIEKGIGAISFWRYEGKQVLISSPGLFCGIGSYLILPDSNQQAKIWNAEKLDEASTRAIPSVPKSSPGSSGSLSVRPKLTDLLTADEKAQAGLTKLSSSELDALNAGLLRIVGALLAVDTKAPSTSSFGAPSSDLDLYDSTGSAVAYITLAEDMVIYTWWGKPVAYLEGESIYGFNGDHLGWFQKGIVYDNKGKAVAALADVFRDAVKPAPPKDLKQLKPLKSLKALKPLKPLFTTTWSDMPGSVFFLLGEK